MRAGGAVGAILRSPVFWGGLAARLVLGVLLGSYFIRDLFVPFVNYYVESGFADPWAHFAALGRLNSFPYPPAMLYLLAVPRWLLGWLLPPGTDTVTGLHFLVLRLPLLAADLGLLLLLVRWFPHRLRRILLLYWCSPFVLYITYWHGQLDLLPTVLFVAGLAVLQSGRPLGGLALFGLAAATKSHLWVALPFVLVYAWQEHGWRRAALGAGLALAVYAGLVLPYLGDPAFRQLVYGTQEQARLFAFQLLVGGSGLAVLLAPGAIALLWFRFAGYQRRNWDLLMLFLGILFCVFILLAPPAPGYFLWSLPFLIHFLARARRESALPYAAYAGAYLAFFWLGEQSDLFDAWRVTLPAVAAWPTPYARLAAANPEQAQLVSNVLFTLMQASLGGIVLNMYLLGVRSNAVYRMRTTPILVGIAGDSGAGKSTLGRLLAEALGERRVTVISGDDYHRWPRGHESWDVFTQLNIRGSDVHQQFEHAVAMHAGRSIVKGVYDHTTGQFTQPQEVDPSQVIIFAGLHALALNSMRRVFDLKIFLDPDEALRRAWKIERDRAERGYTPEAVAQVLEQRRPDRQAYILPQRETADLVLQLVPAEGQAAGEAGSGAAPAEALALRVEARNGFDLHGLAAALQAAGAPATLQPYVDPDWQTLQVAGSLPGERLQALAEALVPNLPELAQQPSFAGGASGLMQLVVLLCLSQILRWGRLPEPE